NSPASDAPELSAAGDDSSLAPPAELAPAPRSFAPAMIAATAADNQAEFYSPAAQMAAPAAASVPVEDAADGSTSDTQLHSVLKRNRPSVIYESPAPAASAPFALAPAAPSIATPPPARQATTDTSGSSRRALPPPPA